MKKPLRTGASLPPPLGSEPNTETFRVGLYLRVSTDRQATEGDSLEEQESELRKYCDYRNFKIHKLYIERGKSGGNTNRPEYKALVRDIMAGKFNAVVVKKLDRLSRSLMDFEELMVLFQTHNIDFISLREQFDTTTAMGKAMLRIALVFAQLEREQTSERIKDVFAYRAEQGLYNGGVRPFGYDCLSSELVPHTHERKAVEFIFDTFLATESTTRTSILCNAAGFRLRNGQIWDARQIHKILTRPIYKGFVKWNENLFQGIHQPLVTPSKWDKAQTIFALRSSNVEKSKVRGMLIGVLRCGNCHNPLMPSYTIKKRGKRYYYYRCKSTFNALSDSCKGAYLAMEPTHQKVTEELLNYAQDHMLSNVQSRIEAHNAKVDIDYTIAKTELQRIKEKLIAIRAKREVYLDSLVSGTFDSGERTRINKKITEFEQEEKQLDSAIWKQDMTVMEIGDLFLDIKAFKEMILKFKINHTEFSEKDWMKWLSQNVTTIDYRDGQYSIVFKALKSIT